MLIFSATVVVAVNTVVCLHTHTRKFRLLGTRKLHGCFLVVAKNFADIHRFTAQFEKLWEVLQGAPVRRRTT